MLIILLHIIAILVSLVSGYLAWDCMRWIREIIKDGKKEFTFEYFFECLGFYLLTICSTLAIVLGIYELIDILTIQSLTTQPAT